MPDGSEERGLLSSRPASVGVGRQPSLRVRGGFRRASSAGAVSAAAAVAAPRMARRPSLRGRGGCCRASSAGAVSAEAAVAAPAWLAGQASTDAAVARRQEKRTPLGRGNGEVGRDRQDWDSFSYHRTGTVDLAVAAL